MTEKIGELKQEMFSFVLSYKNNFDNLNNCIHQLDEAVEILHSNVQSKYEQLKSQGFEDDDIYDVLDVDSFKRTFWEKHIFSSALSLLYGLCEKITDGYSRKILGWELCEIMEEINMDLLVA